MGPKGKKKTGTPAQVEETDDGPVFFYMPDAKYGEFCQWYPSVFTISKTQISELVGRPVDEINPDGSITFDCAEQFMMYCKAARFADTARQAQILATASPKEQKLLGKAIEGFTDESWDQVKSLVVEAGNIAKFGQNSGLRGKLLATGTRRLCEAASRDRVWGIGYSEKHALAHERHWGENRLGKALMATREHLRNEEKLAQAENTWER